MPKLKENKTKDKCHFSEQSCIWSCVLFEPWFWRILGSTWTSPALYSAASFSPLCHFHLLVPHEGQPLQTVSRAVCRSLLHHSIFRPPPLPIPRQYPSCICQTLSLGCCCRIGPRVQGREKKTTKMSFYVIFCIKMCIVKNMFIALKAVPKVLLKSNRFTD